MIDQRAMLMELYRAFNNRDIDGVLEHLAPDVDWPNAATGGRELGREAVRRYWERQWQEIDPRVEPLRIDLGEAGNAHVLVDQLVRSLDGTILQNKRVEHVYTFDGAFVSRMTIVDVAAQSDDDDDDDAS